VVGMTDGTQRSYSSVASLSVWSTCLRFSFTAPFSSLFLVSSKRSVPALLQSAYGTVRDAASHAHRSWINAKEATTETSRIE